MASAVWSVYSKLLPMSPESPASTPIPAAAGLPEEPLHADASRPRWWTGLEIAWIVLLFFLFGGAAAPDVNEPHYLSRAKHFWDPDFCRGDLFLESADAHPVFFATFGWITRWVSLPESAWIGRFVGWALLAAAWHRLSFTLVPRPGASLLSAALWVTLIQRGQMSGEWLIGGIEAKVVAYAWVLWGLSEWVRGRANRTWVLYGAAASFHVLVGGWTIVITLVSGILSGAAERRMIAKSLSGLIVGGAISLAGLLPALRLNAHVPADLVRRAEEIYVFDRIAHHLLIRDFDGTLVIRHTLLVVLFAAFWFALRHDRRFARLGGVVWGATLLVLIGGLLDMSLGNTSWAARALRYYWFRASDVLVPVGVSLATTLLLVRASTEKSRWAAAGLGLVMVLIGGNLIATVAQLQRQPIPAADLQGGIGTINQWMAWKDACSWVRQQAPRSATFLTPIDHQTFKWYAQRPEVVTWKDVPQNAAAIVDWSQRLVRVRHWQQSTTSAESNARFAALADDYAFQYAVVRWPAVVPLPQWPIVYRNSDYVVLRVGPTEGS
jgi:hypothetical protein